MSELITIRITDDNAAHLRPLVTKRGKRIRGQLSFHINAALRKYLQITQPCQCRCKKG